MEPGVVRHLQKLAIEGLRSDAGEYRMDDVEIEGSKHSPPRAPEVPAAVQGYCEYMNANWHETVPFHLAAYSMWRMNWIHPFADGNGRTSRALSYLILLIKLG